VIYAWFRHLPTSTRFSGLLLHQSVDRAGGFPSAPERHDLVGQDGVATTDLRPSGTATFGEERWMWSRTGNTSRPGHGFESCGPKDIVRSCAARA
jgi:hypothetical protein